MSSKQLAKFDIHFVNPPRIHTIFAPANILTWTYTRRKAFLDKQPQSAGYNEIMPHKSKV